MSTAVEAVLNTVGRLWNLCAGNFLLSIPIVMFVCYILVDVITRLKHISR